MARKAPLKFFIVSTAIAVFAVFVFISMASTSNTNYCLSCHEMKSYKYELEKSNHALDKNKKPIECAQCHIPNSFGFKYIAVKTVLGARDITIHYLGSSDDLNRRELQRIARRFIPDENCRACHKDLTKNVKGEKISEIGKLCHEAYLGINGTTKRRCIGCHFNMAHLPDFDRRYFINAEFAKRLPLKKEKK